MELKEVLKLRKASGILMKIVDNPAVVLLAQSAGLDFIFYDCEHGVISYEKLHDLMLMGNAKNFPAIVRVPQLGRQEVSRILDYGATGIMVPMIETMEQAEKLVTWSKYPPIGKRSYAGGANTDYAPSGHHAQHMESLNERTLTIAQIETVKGVENVDEILSVVGVDAAIVGPVDLGISMGNPDNVMDESELQLIRRVADSCKKYKKTFGIIGSVELLKYFRQDLNLMISTTDIGILRNGMEAAVIAYQEIN